MNFYKPMHDLIDLVDWSIEAIYQDRMASCKPKHLCDTRVIACYAHVWYILMIHLWVEFIWYICVKQLYDTYVC